MHEVAGKNESTRLWQLYKQRLVPGRVARRGNYSDAAVTEYVAVARKQFEVLIVVERLRCRVHREFVFQLLDQDLRLPKSFSVAGVVGVCVRDREVGDVFG